MAVFLPAATMRTTALTWTPGIAGIDLVVVNLYPFDATLARTDASRDELVENIDIGGPAMIRAAAKNHDFVTIITDASDYDSVLAEIADGGTTTPTRQRLAAKAFAHTARYDATIASWMTGDNGDDPLDGTLTRRHENKPLALW